MEEDLRQDILPLPHLGEACGGELAHAVSEESGVTADSSSSALYGDVNSSVVQSTEWTDEKHNLYLDLLERSFVDQLNHSKRMCGTLFLEDIKGPCPLSELPMENFAASDEVWQDGWWQKINFQRTKSTTDSCVVKSPWIRHLIAGSRTFSCGLPCTSMQQSAHHICHKNAVGGSAEVTDQNFVDEDEKGELFLFSYGQKG